MVSDPPKTKPRLLSYWLSWRSYALRPPDFPPLPRFGFVGGGVLSSDAFTFSAAAVTNQCSRKLYISNGVVWHPVRLGDQTRVSRVQSESSSFVITWPGTTFEYFSTLL